MRASFTLRRLSFRKNRQTCFPEKWGLLLSALLLVAALGLAWPKPAQAQGGAGTDRSVKAQDFMNTFGVNVHFGQNNYQNTQAIADALNILGFSRIRSTCESAQDVSAWNDVAAKAAGYFPAGLKADVLVTGYLNDPTTFTNQQSTIPQIAGLIETIEGPNEINNYGVGNGTHGPFDTTDQTQNFPSNSAAWAQAIYNWKQGVGSLSQVKLLAPTIASGDPNDYSKMPNVSSYVDSGSIHFYAGNGRQPSGFGGGNFSALYDWDQAASSPGKSLAVTECGQTTASKPGQGGCDNATQAKYVLTQLFDAAAKGASRAYLYQLMDDTGDGDPSGNGGAESHFGLFDYQWNAKPAAQALANLKNLLADSTTNFTPAVPGYSVSGITNAGAAGSSLSVSKSDGSTFIVVWNEPQIWDPNANAPVTPPADAVTISFGGSYTYKVYDPLTGTTAIAAGSGTSVGVNVTGSPILIQLIPIATASAAFVKADAATQGSWKGVYGADGYNVISDSSANNPSYPAYAPVTASPGGSYTWSLSNTYGQALQKAAPGSTDRIAAQWWGSPSFDVDCPLTDGRSHQAALYLLDFDNQGRNETVQVLDAGTNAVLDTRNLTSFAGGVYLIWNVTGHVRFHLVNSGSSSNATLSGLFFDPVGVGALITGTEFDDGAGPYGGNLANSASAALDGSVSTFYDCANSTGYVGLDAGTPTSVSRIVFAPRPGWENRMYAGVFEGSNTSATSGYTTLATEWSVPTDGLTNTLTVTDTTPYRWLRYRDSQGGNCNVAEIQFLDPPAGAPARPSALSTAPGSGRVTLSWHAAAGATSYHVLRSTSSGYTGTKAVAVNVTATSYTDTGLTNGTTYFYQITAVNANGHSGPSNQASAQPVAPPPAPTGLAAAAGAVGSKTIKVSWSASPGATGYAVSRATTSGGTYTKVGTPTTTSFSNTGLTSGATYFYKVSATNAGGTSAPAGPASANAP